MVSAAMFFPAAARASRIAWPRPSRPQYALIAAASAFPAIGSGFLLRVFADGHAGRLPRGEAALELGDALEPHLLSDVGGQRRAPGPVAEEDELLAGGEDRFVIWALGIEPELEHAPGTVKRSGDHALALELAHVAEVDEHHAIFAQARLALLEADRLHPRLRLVDHLLEALLHL